MNGDEYSQRQVALDAEYRRVYEAWVAGLSVDQRKEFERRGLLAPDLGAAGSTSRDQDVAESAEASFTLDIAAELDTLPDFLVEQFGVSRAHAMAVAAWHKATVDSQAAAYKSWLFQKLISGFLVSRNAKLTAAGLAFATNMTSLASVMNGLHSMTAWAKAHHLSRAAVSKVTKRWAHELRLPHSPHMKSQEACARYAVVARQNHWRRQKFDKTKYASKHVGGPRTGGTKIGGAPGTAGMRDPGEAQL